MPSRACVYRFLATAVLAACATYAAAQQIDDIKALEAIATNEVELPQQFFWQSEVLNKDSVQSELAKLYVTLQDNGSLKTKPVIIEKGETPTDLMIRAGVWPKWLQNRMPVELDAALCSLNPGICSFGEKGAPDWTRAWPERTMMVPDVELKLTYQISSREWSRFSAQIVQVAVQETSDFVSMWCRQFPAGSKECPQHEAEKAGWSEQPVIFKYADDSGTLHKEYWAVGDPVALQRLGASASPFKMLAVPVVEATVGLQKGSAGGVARITRTLSDRALFEQKPRLESLSEDNKVPYERMGFSGVDGKLLMPWPSGLVPSPIRIAHIDALADLNHCGFGAGVVFKRYAVDPQTGIGRMEDVPRPAVATIAATVPTPGAATAPACGQIDPAPIEQRSHGTHTLGILVDLLTLGGKAAEPGLDPDLPPIVIYHVPVELSPTNPAAMEQLYKAIRQFPSWGVTLVNISASWSLADTQLIERAINELQDQVLFVAAAGNEQQVDSCSVSPACIKGKNVVSVVALGMDAQNRLTVLDKSNRGLDHDIGALGADIFSAVSDNRIGKLSGTSQAAPLVTAVIAHLMRRGGLGLDWIYERIMTTAVLDSSLLGVSQATMIDMKRAVDVDTDFLDLKNGCRITGKLDRFANDNKITLQEVENSERSSRVEPRDLRRIFFNEQESWHLVMYKSGGHKLVRNTYLISDEDLQREFRFEPATLTDCEGLQAGVVQKFKLSDVKDMIASSK